MSEGFGCYTDPNQPAIDCAVGGLQAAVGGEGLFALIVAGVLVVGFYVASNGGLAAPAVILTLMGSFLIAAIPQQFQTTAIVLIFVGLVSALLALANKYVIE